MHIEIEREYFGLMVKTSFRQTGFGPTDQFGPSLDQSNKLSPTLNNYCLLPFPNCKPNDVRLDVLAQG